VAAQMNGGVGESAGGRRPALTRGGAGILGEVGSGGVSLTSILWPRSAPC